MNDYNEHLEYLYRLNKPALLICHKLALSQKNYDDLGVEKFKTLDEDTRASLVQDMCELVAQETLISLDNVEGIDVLSFNKPKLLGKLLKDDIDDDMVKLIVSKRGKKMTWDDNRENLIADTKERVRDYNASLRVIS